MRKYAIISACVTLGFGVTSANAFTFTEIPQPDAAYQASTTKIDISGLAFGSSHGSISDGFQTVTFLNDMIKLGPVPTGWSTWSSPPFSESANPDVLSSNGFTYGTMDLSTPSCIFGFELEPNPLVPVPYRANFILESAGMTVGVIDITIDGDGGARLVAAKTEGILVDKVALRGTADFAIAQVRYREPHGSWFTGGGVIKGEGRGGKKPAWTFGGNGSEEDAQCAQTVNFQLNDHVNKIAYHFDTLNSIGFGGDPATSPDAPYNTVRFWASGRSNKGEEVDITCVLTDNAESGKDEDTIQCHGDVVVPESTLDGGNIQMHYGVAD